VPLPSNFNGNKKKITELGKYCKYYLSNSIFQVPKRNRNGYDNLSDIGFTIAGNNLATTRCFIFWPMVRGELIFFLEEETNITTFQITNPTTIKPEFIPIERNCICY
jgi:hypothetical protein